MAVNPPLDLTEFQRGEHAPLTAVHPHVVLEDNTRFAVEVTVPSAVK